MQMTSHTAWVVLGMVVLATAPSAQAAWSASAAQSLIYSDNLLHAQTGAEVADLETVTTLGGSADLHWQRQRWRLDLSAGKHQYRSNTDRDNNSWQGALNWDWSSAQALSGNLGLTRSTSLYTYTGLQTVQEAAQTYQRGLNGQVRLGQGGPWSAVLAMQQNNTWYSLAQLDAQASAQNTTSLTLGRRLGERTQLSWVNSVVQTQATRSLVNGQMPESKSRSSQLALDYSYSPRTSLKFSLGRSNGTSSQGQKTPGNVGGLQFNWQPSSRTTLGLNWQRDARNSTSSTSAQSDGQTLNVASVLNESLVRTSGITASWSPSERDRLSFLWSDQQTDSTTLVSSGADLRFAGTKTRKLSLDWSHTLNRTVTLGCSLVQDAVSVQAQTQTASNHPYTVRTATCNAALRLQ